MMCMEVQAKMMGIQGQRYSLTLHTSGLSGPELVLSASTKRLARYKQKYIDSKASMSSGQRDILY